MPVRRTVLTSSANDDKTSEIPLLSLSGDDDYENHSDDSHDDDDNHSPGDQSRVNLKRTLGIRSSVSCIVGIIIGSGIFLSPQGVILYCHSPGLSLIVWVLCGVYALLGAMCYAELGTTYAASGGAYTYLMAMFGEMPAFLLLWSYFIVRIPTGNCLSALIFAKYVLQDVFTCVSPPDSAVRIVAFLVIVIVVLLNCVSIKLTTRVIEVCTYSKVLALVIIIISGIVMLFKGNVDNFQEPFRNSATSPGQVALGFYAGIYSYAGWDSLNSITEELKDPHRTLPVSLGISMCLVTVIYVLTNLAYLTVLTPTEILLSSAVAVSYGGKILAAATWCIPVLVAVSVFGGVNAGFLMASSFYR
ncbi:Y+L amino acid transporter 2-like [Tubulanus polymorphus]|uniref:Y+L amino acid transporter 2-like n=1 Tax=Tubulanus polymorphus TaxID=672921 RepID=UPI003DA3FE84